MQEQQKKHMNQQQQYRVLGPVASIFEAANTGSWRLEKPKVNYSECIKCGNCERYCPANVITIHKDKEECIEFMWDYCKGCGVCSNVCPKDCINMVNERDEK